MICQLKQANLGQKILFGHCQRILSPPGSEIQSEIAHSKQMLAALLLMNLQKL
jgi:hypothetical protein